MILQADLTPDTLAASLRELIAEPGLITEMETAAKAMGRPIRSGRNRRSDRGT